MSGSWSPVSWSPLSWSPLVAPRKELFRVSGQGCNFALHITHPTRYPHTHHMHKFIHAHIHKYTYTHRRPPHHTRFIHHTTCIYARRTKRNTHSATHKTHYTTLPTRPITIYTYAHNMPHVMAAQHNNNNSVHGSDFRPWI